MEWYKNWRYANLMTSGYGCNKYSRIDDAMLWTLVIYKLLEKKQRMNVERSQNSGVMLLGHQWVLVLNILIRALKLSEICSKKKNVFFSGLIFYVNATAFLASRELRPWYYVFSVNRRINALYKSKLIFENDSAIKIILATERIFLRVKN